MLRRKPNKTPKNTSTVTVANSKRKKIKASEKFDMFPLAAIVMGVAVYVAPLTALFTCKYTGLTAKRKAS